MPMARKFPTKQQQAQGKWDWCHCLAHLLVLHAHNLAYAANRAIQFIIERRFNIFAVNTFKCLSYTV